MSTAHTSEKCIKRITLEHSKKATESNQQICIFYIEIIDKMFTLLKTVTQDLIRKKLCFDLLYAIFFSVSMSSY